VPQNINMNCDFRVKDYLVLGRNPYIVFGNPKSSDYELVEFYADKTGITDILEKNFNSLSGGQKQWVTITRALVQETEIIIMDEPMSALDMGKQAELMML
jgi:iron complex transport system ATP-binding protein